MKEKYLLWLAAALLAAGAIEAYIWQSGEHGGEPPPQPVQPTDSFPYLTPGEIAPPFEAERLAGGRELIDYPEGGGKTFLFVFSLSCGTCAKNIPHWNRIARETEGRTRAFGLVIDRYQKEQKLLREKALEFPALRFSEDELRLRYKVTRVPKTLLVGPGGKVEKTILGELSEALVKELLARARAGAGVAS